MKLAFCYLLTLLFLLGYGTYKHNGQQRHNENVLPKATGAKTLELLHREESRKIQTFFKNYDSPLESQADDIVNASYVYGIDYRILPAIAMVESGGCKYPAPGTLYNCFGFKSYSSPNGWWRFENYNESIWKIAQTLGTNPAYKRFQETGQIQELAIVYNLSSQKWIEDVNYFYNQIK